MPLWDLSGLSQIGKTRCMLLPQSNARFLLASAIPWAALIILIMMLPARVLAANQLTCSPSSLNYSHVVVGQSETLLVAVINNGPKEVTISRVSVSNADFKVSNLTLPKALAAGESTVVSLAFAPKQAGSVNGEVTFTSNASNSTLSLGVEAAGVTSNPVTASPASMGFGNVAVGESSTRPVVLTNTRTWSVPLGYPLITGGEFSLAGAKFPLTLAGGQSIKLTVTFTPRAPGLSGGSAFLNGPPLTIPLAGTGTGLVKPELAITPATLSFSDAAIGTTKTLTLGLKASGGSVIISSASSSNSQFAVPSGVFPLTIPVGTEVSLNVTFTPKNSGKTSATLSFHSNAANSSSEDLAGTGTAPEVSLSWIASTSEVAGYNVYRRASNGSSYTKINSSLDRDTSYTDASVIPGTAYYYATTAVNPLGKESEYSNAVEVKLP